MHDFDIFCDSLCVQVVQKVFMPGPSGMKVWRDKKWHYSLQGEHAERLLAQSQEFEKAKNIDPTLANPFLKAIDSLEFVVSGLPQEDDQVEKQLA